MAGAADHAAIDNIRELTSRTAFLCANRQIAACFFSHHQTSRTSVSLNRRIVSRLVVSERVVHGSVRLVLCSLVKAARSIVALCKTSPGDWVRASGPAAR